MSAPPVHPADAAATYAAFLPAKYRSQLADPAESTFWQWRNHQVHLLRRRSATAPVRLILVHGAGAHAAALWPFAAVLPAHLFDLTAVDMPLYGWTRTPYPAEVRYQDWLQLLSDFVKTHDDGRPLLLLGASIGGMLAYEVAEQTQAADAVAATCLLDPRDRRVQASLTRFGRAGVIGGVLAQAVRGRIAGQLVPIKWAAAMTRMSRDPRLSALCAADARGGGAQVPLGFLASFMRHRHTPPELARTPLTMVHPAEDAWTPVEISMGWFSRIAAPTSLVLLAEGGHFPVEESAVDQLLASVTELGESLAGAD